MDHGPRTALSLTCPACQAHDAVGTAERGLWYCWQCQSQGTLGIQLDVTRHGEAMLAIDETVWGGDDG